MHQGLGALTHAWSCLTAWAGWVLDYLLPDLYPATTATLCLQQGPRGRCGEGRGNVCSAC